MVRRFFRRSWHESRGDAFDAWGPAVYFFEVGDDGWPVRQIEVYDTGPTLRYGLGHTDDAFGGLAQRRLDELEDWSVWEISREVFDQQWASVDDH